MRSVLSRTIGLGAMQGYRSVEPGQNETRAGCPVRASDSSELRLSSGHGWAKGWPFGWRTAHDWPSSDAGSPPARFRFQLFW